MKVEPLPCLCGEVPRCFPGDPEAAERESYIACSVGRGHIVQVGPCNNRAAAVKAWNKLIGKSKPEEG